MRPQLTWLPSRKTAVILVQLSTQAKSNQQPHQKDQLRSMSLITTPQICQRMRSWAEVVGQHGLVRVVVCSGGRASNLATPPRSRSCTGGLERDSLNSVVVPSHCVGGSTRECSIKGFFLHPFPTLLPHITGHPWLIKRVLVHLKAQCFFFFFNVIRMLVHFILNTTSTLISYIILWIFGLWTYSSRLG